MGQGIHEGPRAQSMEHTGRQAISPIRRRVEENSLELGRGLVRAVQRGGRNEAPDQLAKRQAEVAAGREGYFKTATATGGTIIWSYIRTEPASSVDGKVRVTVPVHPGDLEVEDALILTSPTGTKVQRVDKAEERRLTERFGHKRQVVVHALPTERAEEVGTGMVSSVLGGGAGLPVATTLLPRIGYPFAMQFYDIPLDRGEIREAMEEQRSIIGANSETRDPDKKRRAEEADLTHKKLHSGEKTGLSYYVAEVSAQTDVEAAYMAALLAEELRTVPNVDVAVTAEASVDEALEKVRIGPQERRLGPEYGLTARQISEAFPANPEGVRGIRTYKNERWETSLPLEPNPLTIGRLISDGQAGDAATIPAGAFGEIVTLWASTQSGKTTFAEILVAKRVKHAMDQGENLPGVIFVDLKGNKAADNSIGEQMKNLYDYFGINAKVATIRPGELADVSVGLNPIDPGREPMHTYLPKVAVMLTDCFELIGGKSGEDSGDNRESMLRIITSAVEGNDFRDLEGLMRVNGWDPQTGQPMNENSNPMMPVFVDLVLEARMSAKSYGYAGELNKNLPVWAEMRMLSIASRSRPSGRFFSGASMDKMDALDEGALLHYDLSGMDRVSQSMGLKLLFLRAYGYAQHTPGKKVVLVIDEINKLATKGSPMEADIVDLVQRAAGLGVDMIFCGQDVSTASTELVNNANTTFVGNLSGEDNHTIARAITGATQEQLEEAGERRRFALRRKRTMKYPAQVEVTDVKEIIDGVLHPQLTPLENVVDLHVRGTEMYTEAEIINFHNELDRELTGAVLTVFADVAAATTLAGLESHVGIDWSNIAPEGGPELEAAKYFRRLMEMPTRKKAWMIKEAARRAVVHRPETQDLGRDKGVSVGQVITKVERDLQAALQVNHEFISVKILILFPET